MTLKAETDKGTITFAGCQLDDLGLITDLLASIPHNVTSAIVDWGWGEQVIFDENGLYII